MSRTYRARHLPRTGGSPRKIGDAEYCSRGEGYLKFKKTFPKEIEAEHIRQLYTRELRENPPAIGPIWDHPWIGFTRANNPSKKYYRSYGNRKVRKYARLLCKEWAIKGDDFKHTLPIKRDGWDVWSLT